MSKVTKIVPKGKVAATPKVSSRKVPAGVLRKLTNASKKAEKKLSEIATTAPITADALAGIAHVRTLLPAKQEGKLSRLGHKMGCQNGRFDEAILTCNTADFAEWVKAVAKAECKSRKTKPEDTKGLIVRLVSHAKAIGGLKSTTSQATFKKRLTNVGLEAHHEVIMGALAPFAVLFTEYNRVGKF